MRRSGTRERGFSEPGTWLRAALVCICAFAGSAAFAADLDRHPAPVPPTIAVPSACHLVPQPRANLAGEVVRFRPSVVCLSRGVYADTLPPPLPERPWWWLW